MRSLPRATVSVEYERVGATAGVVNLCPGDQLEFDVSTQVSVSLGRDWNGHFVVVSVGRCGCQVRLVRVRRGSDWSEVFGGKCVVKAIARRGLLQRVVARIRGMARRGGL